jgi:hypothetical protein
MSAIDQLIRSYPELRDGGGLLLESDAGSNDFQVLRYESEDDYANEDQLILLRLFEMNDRVIC